MQIKKLSMLLILASTLATGTAIAQETDGATDTDDAQTERQRADRDQARQRRENMSDEDRAAARERRENMSDEDRQVASTVTARPRVTRCVAVAGVTGSARMANAGASNPMVTDHKVGANQKLRVTAFS